MDSPNQVALITGSARRIGAALARTLHQAGMNIVIHYHHSKVAAHDLATELNEIRPQSAIALKADLDDLHQCQQLVISAQSYWQRLDILINNASTFFPTPIGETTEAEFNNLIASNFKGPFFLSQYAKPALAEKSGCIINITDIHGFEPMRNYSVYCAAKAALIMITKTMAKELAPQIRVNGIAPGPTLWPEGVNKMDPSMQEAVIKKIPMQRIASPTDICETALFLINQQYITGQIIAVDGGRHL